MSEAMFRLDGKKALVTGASRGIGAGVAAMLARQGADVAICSRSSDSLAATAAAIEGHGRRTLAVEMDIRDTGSIARGVTYLRDAFGDIDILVNNAGINHPAAGLDVNEAAWDDHFDTNVKGGFFLAQELAPHMIAQKWGRVIWMGSQSGLVAIPGQPTYCATKAAVSHLARSLAVEWAEYGVTVNSVAPTWVATELSRERLSRPEFREHALKMIPVGRIATVDEIAAAVVYLASIEASMVTGHTLVVDGGWTAW